MQRNSGPVGFIGLGNMGAPIADRLVGAGMKVHVHDLDPQAAQRLAECGAIIESSGKAVADAAETVCTCVPSSKASEGAVFGANGVSLGRRIRYYVEMSTVGPHAIRAAQVRLAERQIATLDAPVSGGAAGARAGTLSIMISGTPEVRDAVHPVLSAISSRIFVIGNAPGEGQIMKLVNNLLAAANMASSYEALALGVKLGLPPSKIVEVVNASSGRNTGMDERKTTAILTRRFEGLGAISLLQKDIALAFDVAREAGFPLSALHAFTGMARLWDAAVAQGMSGEDVSALIKVIERAAGVEVRA
jgi:3-hydroxyisobutyrate dehydrogenase